MTLSKKAKLEAQEKDIKVFLAKKTGWRVYKSNGQMYYERPGGDVHNHVTHFFFLPDYIGCFKALHDIETRCLTGSQLYFYHAILRRIVEREALYGRDKSFVILATPRQRCMALLIFYGYSKRKINSFFKLPKQAKNDDKQKTTEAAT